MERWAPVPWSSDYEVSDHGRARRITPGRGTFPGKILNTKPNRRCYVYVNVGRPIQMHKLVCLVFNGPPPSQQHEVAHRDGDRANNLFSNLAWKTHKENMADIKIHGTENPPVGERQGRSKLKQSDVEDIIARSSSGEGVVEIARSFGVTHGTIGHIIKRRNWRHIGDGNDGRIRS